MTRYHFLFAIVFALCLVAPSTKAQQASSPDDGDVRGGVYTNRHFGFSVRYPKDWVVHGEATNVRLKELGKERATTTGAMSASTSEVLLRNTYHLLTTFQYPMGAAVAVNPGFLIVAEKVSHAPGIATGRDYLLSVRPLMIKTGVIPMHDEPIEQTLARHKFFRQDSQMLVNGLSVEQSIVITIYKGFAIAFILSADDRPTIDEMLKAVATLKFSAPPSDSPGKTPVTSKPKPRRRS